MKGVQVTAGRDAHAVSRVLHVVIRAGELSRDEYGGHYARDARGADVGPGAEVIHQFVDQQYNRKRDRHFLGIESAAVERRDGKHLLPGWGASSLADSH